MFRKFPGWEFWNFLSITVFRGLDLTKHCNAQKTHLSQPQNSQNLSIAVFPGLNLTKHCSAQNKPKFHSPETHETLPEFFEFLEFF